LQIAFLEVPYLRQVGPQGFLDRAGKHGDTILVPLAFTDHDFVAVELDILDPQA
jgi:hypothetical protein